MTKTLLELINSCVALAVEAKIAADSDQRQGLQNMYAEAHGEIRNRLELISRYGGTEASHIKCILKTGRPLDGWIAEPAAKRRHLSECGLSLGFSDTCTCDDWSPEADS